MSHPHRSEEGILVLLLEIFSFEMTCFGAYPGWHFCPDMVAICCDRDSTFAVWPKAQDIDCSTPSEAAGTIDSLSDCIHDGRRSEITSL